MDILEYVSHPNFLSFHSNKGKHYFSVWMKAEQTDRGKWRSLDGRTLPYNIYIVNFDK